MDDKLTVGLRKEALRDMKRAQRNGDTEGAHCDADAALCVLLIGLGFGDVVAEYRKVEKWFA